LTARAGGVRQTQNHSLDVETPARFGRTLVRDTNGGIGDTHLRRRREGRIVFEAQPGREPTPPRTEQAHADAAALFSMAEERRLRRQIQVRAADARQVAASRRFGSQFDRTVARVRDELDLRFWTRDDWGSSFDREHFARTVVALVENRHDWRDADPRLVTAVLDCLHYSLTSPVSYQPGGPAWSERRCTTTDEDVLAADAVAAIFEARVLPVQGRDLA
jgi:uncharacterized membrane protein YccC